MVSLMRIITLYIYNNTKQILPHYYTMNTTQSEEYDEYVRRKVWRPFLTDSSRNYEEESKTWKSFSQEEINNENW